MNPAEPNAEAHSAPPAPASDPTRPSGFFHSSASSAAMAVYVPATLAIRLINFGRVIMLTWFMTTQQFGLLNILLLVINVLTPMCSIGLNEAVTRYVPQFESRGRLNRFLIRALALLVAVAAGSTLLLLLLAPRVGMRFFGSIVYDESILQFVRPQMGRLAQISAGVIGLLILYFFLLAVLKGLRMIRAVALAELLHSLLFLGLSLAACLTDHASAKTMTACYGLSLALTLVVCGSALFLALRNWTGQSMPLTEGDVHHRLLAFSIWAMISGVTWQVLQYYPAWYLNRVMGNDAVAVFAAVRQIGQFVLLGAVTLVTVVMTAVTKTWETRGVEAADRQLSLAFRAAGVGMLLGCSVLALSRHAIIRLFNPSYAPGADVLPLQLLFFLIGGNFAFIALHFSLIEKPRLHFLPYAVGVAANVLLGFWLLSPRLADMQATTAWRAVAPIVSSLVTADLTDSLGLRSASWSGVLAIMAALLACLVLLRSEGRRLDRGSYIVLLAALLLAANDVILVIGVTALAAVCFGTELVFSASERRELRAYVFAAWRSLLRPKVASVADAASVQAGPPSVSAPTPGGRDVRS